MDRGLRALIGRIGCCAVMTVLALAVPAARAAGTRRLQRIALVPQEGLKPNIDTDRGAAAAAVPHLPETAALGTSTSTTSDSQALWPNIYRRRADG